MGAVCSSSSSSGGTIKRKPGVPSIAETHHPNRPVFSESIEEAFELFPSDVVGRGGSGTVYRCQEKATGNWFVVKHVVKKGLSERELENLYREVKIQALMGKALSAVGLYSQYEDSESYYLVMEACNGGTLLSRMHSSLSSEDDVRAVMAHVSRFVAQCHSLHVCYRDLKPAQFLYVDDRKDSPLKGTDFGVAILLPPGATPLTLLHGTPAYMAPEVIAGSYGLQSDMWSMGVMAYQLLSGELPFSARQWVGNDPVRLRGLTQKDKIACLFKDIQRGIVELIDEPWDSLSPEACDFVGRLLCVNPDQRLDAESALRHPWITGKGGGGGGGGAKGGKADSRGSASTSTSLGDSIVQRLQRFSTMGHFKQLMLLSIARSMDLPEEARRKQEQRLENARALFEELGGEAGEGGGQKSAISAKDLAIGLNRCGFDLKEEEVCQLVDALDFNGTGSIELEEFEAAMWDWKTLAEDVPEEVWREAAAAEFDHLRAGSREDGGGGGAGPSSGTDHLSMSKIESALSQAGAAPGARRTSDADQAMMIGDRDLTGAIKKEEFLELAKPPPVATLDMYESRKV